MRSSPKTLTAIAIRPVPRGRSGGEAGVSVCSSVSSVVAATFSCPYSMSASGLPLLRGRCSTILPQTISRYLLVNSGVQVVSVM